MKVRQERLAVKAQKEVEKWKTLHGSSWIQWGRLEANAHNFNIYKEKIPKERLNQWVTKLENNWESQPE